VKLKSAGADALVIAASPKFAAQAIRKTYEINWRPMTFLTNVSVWMSSVMEPAGLDAGHRHYLERLCQGSARSDLGG
jgi:branched-chain amino acid transport system substrate-binding protein